MPTSLPIAVPRRRSFDFFLIGLIVLYAACALAMVDEIARGTGPAIDMIAAQADPGL